MELFESVAAYLLHTIATVAAWIGAHIWIVPLVCAAICFAIVAHERYAMESRKIDRITEDEK